MVFKRELEKQIAKLKQENAELKEQNSHLYNDLTMTEAENVELEQQIKKYIEGNEKLEKENAELEWILSLAPILYFSWSIIRKKE